MRVTGGVAGTSGLWTPRFRLLLATRLASQAGDGVLAAGVAWLVLLSPDAQRTPGAFVGVLALLLLPFSLVGPFAGIVLDRYARRHVLVRGQLIRAGVVLLVAVVASTFAASPIAYALVLVALGINRLLLAALSAAVPHTVARRDLVTANALAPTAGTVATGAGTVTGAAALAVSVSPAGVLVLATGFYLGAALIAARFAAPSLGPDTGERPPGIGDVLGDLFAAAWHLSTRRRAVGALAALGGLRLLLGGWTLWVFTMTLAESDESDASVIAVATAAGYLAAAVLTPPLAGRWGMRGWLRRLSVTLIAAIAATAAIAAGTGPVDAGAGWLLAWSVQGLALGIGGQVLKIHTDTVVQRDVDEPYLGRVFTLYDVLFNVCLVAGALAAVPLL